MAKNQDRITSSEYCFPPISILFEDGTQDGTAEIQEDVQQINEALSGFHINGHVVNVIHGSNTTRYDVELEKGVRWSSLMNAIDDIALNLGVFGVRIFPVGESLASIEVPYGTRRIVSLGNVIGSDVFLNAKSKCSIAVGSDSEGNYIVCDIARLPHLLIADSEGFDKTMCLNSIIISLLYKSCPEDVKMIMIDSKMAELEVYNGIPHLLTPGICDFVDGADNLRWAVKEMMRRYKSMSDAGVRDLEAYNSIMESEEDGKKLPRIMVIIDELADLILYGGEGVEVSISRIAMMGRGAGIHLIIGTRYPSSQIITDNIKENIPSRISFAVASAKESRIILDTQGAEKLVGHGDMLFAPIGVRRPQRVQGCFVSDLVVNAVTAYVKENIGHSEDYE